TICCVTPTRAATVVFAAPVAHASTMRARGASACAVFGRRAHCASTSRSVAVTLSSAFGRPNAIRHLLIAEDGQRLSLFDALRAQDTRSLTWRPEASEGRSPVQWSSNAGPPDDTAFTDFLGLLNTSVDDGTNPPTGVLPVALPATPARRLCAALLRS